MISNCSWCVVRIFYGEFGILVQQYKYADTSQMAN